MSVLAFSTKHLKSIQIQKKEKIGKENTGKENNGGKKGTHNGDQKENEGQENEKKQCSPVIKLINQVDSFNFGYFQNYCQ